MLYDETPLRGWRRGAALVGLFAAGSACVALGIVGVVGLGYIVVEFVKAIVGAAS